VEVDAPNSALLAAALRTTAAQLGAPIYLGQGSDGPAWAAPQRSTLVLGPSRSGKTSSIVIPNVLAAPGAVVSTSTKPDVLEATVAARAGAGAVLLYDPSGAVEAPPGVHRIGWSPVAGAERWDTALLTAGAMVRTAASSNWAGDSHWTERSAALLAPLLHAAALDHEPMATVLQWVDRHQGGPALETLAARTGETSTPTNLLDGIVATDPREQSGIWSTASGVLAAYRTRAALDSTTGPLLDPDAFCAGAHTLYVCAPGRTQQFLAPLIVGLLSDVRDAAYRRAPHADGNPPVLLALDEVANIAPLPDLPAVVSEGAGQGLLTLACLQDLSQARTRWGHQADALVSLFGTTVVLPGIADLHTLRLLSELAGEVEVPVRGVSASKPTLGRVHHAASIHTTWRPRLPIDAIGRGAPGCALAVDDRNRMGWVRLTPAHEHALFRELTGGDRQRAGWALARASPGPEGLAR
jgi:type IV secretory pathway TraG/TraD family ATPase VirD4